MQCSIRLDRDRNCGNVKMKTINSYKNPYKKEPNLDIIVDQLAIQLQDIKDQERTVGMPTCSIEQAEAVRRYCAAFPALTKDKSSLQYCLPPPAWCKKQPVKMQCHELSKDWKKKIPTGRERRNSYQGQRKNKKRCNGYSRSFESKESLPEWVTHEGIWDMETQDPVREFIRAIALDEGYGTCENTVTDDMQDISTLEPRIRMVPEWDDGLDLAGQWVITDEPPPRPLSPSDEELYARFEAKFDRSIEALWARDQNTPDDDYQELPIDFAELLSSPSDQMFGAPPPPPLRFASVMSPPSLSSLPSLADSVWACDAPGSPPLHDRLRPLQLASPPPRPQPPPPPPPELESFALYDGDELYDALSTVANTVRSLTAINHSRDTSGFCEVPPRRRAPPPAPPASPPARRDAESEPEREDLLTAARTHFRPIEREPEAEAPRYADGDTFDIRGEPDVVEYRRSASGGAYIGAGLYLVCRGAPAPLRFAVRQQDAGVQTEAAACDGCASQAKKMRPAPAGAGACVACAPAAAPPAPPPDEMSCDWEELLADISAAHAHYAAAPAVESEEGGADRKRRHSAALRCARRCAHPHARFLPCHALDRPLTR